MTFASTVIEKSIQVGKYKKAIGTYTSSGGGTGGDITVPGARQIIGFQLTPTGATVNTNAPSVNETLPLTSAAVTIVTDANTTGVWEALYR